MKIKNVLILILGIFFLISCSNDEEETCLDFEETADVTAVEAPDAATVNEAVDVEVTFSANNSCGQFGNFDSTTSGTTRTVSVMAVYEGCNCAEVITPRTATYTFTPEQTGEYVLRFASGDDEFVEERITVQEAS